MRWKCACKQGGLTAPCAGEGKQRPFDILKIGIRMRARRFYRRIDDRVDGMVAEGLEREAGTLPAAGLAMRCKRSATVSFRIFRREDYPGQGDRAD